MMYRAIRTVMTVIAVMQVIPLLSSQDIMQTRLTLEMNNASMLDVVNELRMRHRIPISFIQADESFENPKMMPAVSCRQLDLKECFRNIILQDPRYIFHSVDNHWVVFPNEKKYQRVIDFATDGKKKRSMALSEYVYYLWTIPGFSDLARPVRTGDLSAPIYTDLVGVTSGVSVIRGFMQLLGNNPNATLSIEKARFRDGSYKMQIKLLSVDSFTMEFLSWPVSIEIDDASMINVVDYFRHKYHIPISFIQATEQEEMLYNIKYYERRFDVVIYDVIRQYYKNYVAQMINKRFVIYPNDSVFQNKVTDIPTGPMEREAAAAKLFNAIGDQHAICNSYILTFSGDKQSNFAQDNVDLKGGDSVIESIVGLLGNDYFHTFTIMQTNATAWKITFDSLER